ncbi:MAG: hypothetical protein JO149_05185, partial [Gammaproteobacteria bacterium]|nr:hypothetical protein [Gammaproteobacteria bacterium]
VWVRTNKKGVTYIGSGKEYLKTLGSGEIVTLETLAKHNYVHAKTLKEIPNSPDNQKKLAKFGNKKWFVMNEPYVRKKMENDTNQQSHASLKRKHEHEPEQSVYNQKYSPTLFTMPQKNNNAPEQIITRSLTHK